MFLYEKDTEIPQRRYFTFFTLLYVKSSINISLAEIIIAVNNNFNISGKGRVQVCRREVITLNYVAKNSTLKGP